MATSQPSRLYVELSEHGIVLARVSGEGNSRKISFWGEASKANKESLKSLVSAAGLAELKKPEKATVLLRPDGRNFHLCSAEEAKRLTASEPIKEFINESPVAGYEPCEVTSVYAHGGAPVDGRSKGRWLAAAVPQEAAALTLESFSQWNIKPGRIECATLAWLGACSSVLETGAAGAPVAVCDLGPRSSSVFLVDERGVTASVTAPTGFDHVMEVIHSELHLKFHGAANRLFFNDRYDFSKIESTVAGQFAEILAPDLKDLVGSDRRKAASFVLTGLPSGQAWLGKAVAKALEIPEWTPSIGDWASQTGIKWSARGPVSDLSASAIGMLQVATSDPCEKDENRVWRARWCGANVTEQTDASGTEELLKEAAKASAALKAPLRPNSDAKSTGAGAGDVAGETTKQKPKRAAAMPVAESKRLRAKLATKKAAAKAPVATKAAQPSDEAKPKPKPKPQPAAGKPQPAKKAGATEADKPAKKRRGAIIGAISMAACIALLAGFGYVYFQKVEEQKVEAELRAVAEAAARKQAEEDARLAAEAKRRAEEQAAREAAEAEEARRLAEAARLEKEAERERLLNARGTVVIMTKPEGATVRLGNLAPLTTPARFPKVHLGGYKARIDMVGYDSVELDVEVTENGIFDPGVIELRKQVGSIEIVSHPADATFDIRPANSGLFVPSDQTLMGQTPGRVDDLTPGDYVVTILRQGWPSHTETVTVKKFESEKVDHRFVGGTVEIVSQPMGALVTVNGNPAGRTPLTLSDLAPGEVICSFALENHISATVAGTVIPGQTVPLSAELESEDRIVNPDDLDNLPEPIELIEPLLPDAGINIGNRVVISITVDEEGYPSDPHVAESYSADASKACMDTVLQWRFKPGLVKGRPVKTRVAIPFQVR